MTSYSELMAEFSTGKPDYAVDLPDNWTQGRTAFGGLTSGLLAAAIANDHPDLPGLRTAQINFAGPATGRLNVSHELLRRGKNNITFSAKLDSEMGAGTYGLLTYGVQRRLPEELDYPRRVIDIKPADAEPFFPSTEGAPRFLSNIDRRWVSGPRFLEGSDKPDMLFWARLTDAKSWDQGLVPLIILADTPPAAFGFLTKPFRALSSISWHINLLTDDLSTEDGWWLMRSAATFIKDGYVSQVIEVWNSDGRRVMDSLQLQALFV